MCFNKKFYIVKNDVMQNTPCHVMNYSPLVLGRPVIKMNPYYTQSSVVPIKIRTPDLNFVLNMPFQHIRPMFDDIYRFRMQDTYLQYPKNPGVAQNEVVYSVNSPGINTSVSTSYPVFLKILSQVGTLYSPGTYVQTEDGSRLKGLELVDGLLQKLIDMKNKNKSQ